jgi:hypothetical protein
MLRKASSREYNSAKEICKYASFSKVGLENYLELCVNIDIDTNMLKYN